MKDVAVDVPKDTAVVVSRSVPVMMTSVPPSVDPEVGVRAVTVGGGGATYVY